MPNWPQAIGRRALITGITGQDGSYLAEHLLAKGYHVWGLVRRASSLNRHRIDHLYEDPHGKDVRLRLAYGDLSDAPSLRAVLREVMPQEIYHLGAQSHVQVSFELPEYTADITGLGTLRILQGVRELEIPTRFYQASSSEIFGNSIEEPQTEATPLRPRSPYAAAKAFAHHITRVHREAYGLFAVNGILYNHESPRRGESFVTRKIARGAAAIARGRAACLYLGNLESRRDWGFAGDYVDAMWRMLQRDKPEDFVIATGESHSVRELCELSFSHAGVPIRWQGEGQQQVGVGPDGAVRIAIDPNYLRPAEVGALRGDARKAERELGWRPSVGFEALVRMMVDAEASALDAAAG